MVEGVREVCDGKEGGKEVHEGREGGAWREDSFDEHMGKEDILGKQG